MVGYMARLKIVPRWFPRRFDVVDAVGRRVATINGKRSCIDVKLTVKGATYVIENRQEKVALAHHGHDTARASFTEAETAAAKRSSLTSISIQYGSRLFALEDRTGGVLSAAKYVARERGRIVGTVRSRVVDLPETVPLHIRIFMAWLVATAELQQAAT